MTTARQDNWHNAIDRARAHAPFLARGLERMPDLAELLAAGQGEAALAWARQAGADAADVRVGLRRERLAYAVALAIGDLAGVFPVGRVMQELSDLADRALDAAITAAISRRVPDAQPAGSNTGMIALALGKHGADELNFSSDIDPILLFDPEVLPRRDRDEPGEAAQRYARDIVQILAENTAEGYVFRVDLRLRPASEVSPLAISLGAALSHYESSALTWERAAFIRARACSGDVAAGDAFLAAIRPFIWRRSLDFGAIEEIGRLTARIRDNYAGPKLPGPGFNLKHGRGGIREVEFFAQTHQLIHGGRNPSLRQRGTRPALDALAAAGLISDEDAKVVGGAYDRLRTLEHRLQMVDDQQTHALPAGGEALDNVARLEGMVGAAALVAEVAELTEAVGARFDRLIDVDNRSVQVAGTESNTLSERLTQLGFENSETLAMRIDAWTDGHFRALRSPAACAAFAALLPQLLEALSQAADPDRAILRWEALLAGASSVINLFRLLEARPALLDQVVKILTLTPPLADKLGRRPELLDTLIDRSALDLPGNVAELASAMKLVANQQDYESQLDRIRIVTGEKRFALGVQLIDAAHDPLAIGAALSRLAEAAITVAVDAASEEFAQAHGLVTGSELVVLGLGRLGGGVLTHASDLDIIYLFSDTLESESACAGFDSCRPLGTGLYFNRLASRVSGALSVPTAEGALYEVDTRLRPQGKQGPLAVSFDSFGRYQRESAWTWEHMALTRARVLSGSPAVRAALSGLISDVLNTPRDGANLRESLLTMRSEMAVHKAPQGPLDAKLLRGGLVDLEFLVHYLQLRERTAFHPGLGEAIGQLIAAGLLPHELADAHNLMIRMLVAARLLAPDLKLPAPAATEVLARACGSDSGEGLLAQFALARHSVADSWKVIFNIELETTYA